MKIDWKKKAENWLEENILQLFNPVDLQEILKKLARSLRYEHMFRKLWKMMMEADICPWDMCLMSDKLKKDWGCPCKKGDTKKCWRRLRMELKK